MGCTSSTEATDKHDIEKSEKAKMDAAAQRRRLSVSPEHVGDITQGVELKGNEKKNAVDSHQEHGKAHDFQYTTVTKKGYVPYNLNKVNQDRDVVAVGLANDENISLFGCMDGHGEFGHEVSEYCKLHLPRHLSTMGAAAIRKDPHGCIKKGTAALCARLAESEISCAFSGTTAVYSLIIDKKIYVANIGDSRCVVAKRSSDGFQAVPLSEDQKPDNPNEKKRILAAGGRVETLPGPPGEDNGPYRVWLKDVDVPGLAMARSIGDEVSHTVGVIDVPEITEHEIADDDLFAIWASDGVWEFLENEDVLKLVYDQLKAGGPSADNLDTCANLVVKASHEQWTKNEDVVDDITCVIVKFHDL